MYITANGENVEIEEEQRDENRYLVAKGVPIVKPMELDTGYVPESSIAASVDIENTHGSTGWSGTTPTLNHPRNDPAYSWHEPSRPNDELVLAANDDVQETLGVGTIENDHWDGEFVRADIAVNVNRAEEMGGEALDIVDALENGGPLEVSSQYLHAELPTGNYDGEHRDEPKAIAAPDSVALIPNGKGVCSIDDGCGIAPGVTANVAEFPDVVANAAVGADDPGNSGEGQRSTMQDPAQMAGVRQVLSGIASLLPAAGSTDKTAANITDTPDDDPRGGVADTDTDSDSDEGAESSTDATTTANTTMKDDKRNELIQFIAANSDLKEDSLEHMGDRCLENTHEMVVANAADDSNTTDADGDDDDDDGTDTTDVDDDVDTTDDVDGDTLADMTVEDLATGLKDQGFVTEDSIGQHVETAANELEKEERAENIVANSSEYDEDDVEWIAELPEKELERKEQSTSMTGGVPASGSPDFGASANEDETEASEMPDLEVS